jgi:hypothetical protein
LERITTVYRGSGNDSHVKIKALTALICMLNYQDSFSITDSQSALHYLIIHGGSRQSNMFKNPQSGPVRSRLIKAFLERGADPNAIGSRGRTVLEYPLPTCPYDVIEFMPEKGAKITLRLVSKSSAPRHPSLPYFPYFPDPVSSENINVISSSFSLGSEPVDNLEVPYLPAGDILDEERWRRPECFTDEARELSRPHNPHWA